MSNLYQHLIKLLATWFYSGCIPKAPGTFGSLATLPFVYVLSWYWGWQGLAVFALAVMLTGWTAASAYAKILQKKDPGCIVIDETAGQTIALLAAGTNLWLYVLGFVLFRLFDIAKPGPVGWADRKVGGGLGIMLDDIFAGAGAGMIVAAVRFGF